MPENMPGADIKDLWKPEIIWSLEQNLKCWKNSVGL